MYFALNTLTRDVLKSRFLLELREGEDFSVDFFKEGDKRILNIHVGNTVAAHCFSVALADSDKSDEEALLFLTDFMLDSLKEFFSENRGAFFPLDYAPYDFDDQLIYAKHEFRNFKVEDEATQLLGPDFDADE